MRIGRARETARLGLDQGEANIRTHGAPVEDMVEIEGQTYRVMLFSNVVDDMMCLELWDTHDTMIASVNYHDQDGRMTFDGLVQGIPLGVVEWMIESARKRLPPKLPI
ncbi:hypothetical protein GAO09_26105 [Rhizobiales bacterium RZME27]|uniref:Uncharacterized protein n=1 Tax=Endobacterium cereale TaxID=2663029 RepID=A0A6A8ADX5_9HYPH|nr:hypothetical protein [Endobacterium cereale]MEB2843903.1 hypothetical protein [Endobacterium cereale]MQY49513.1 hypothetical protein [Endobacterium cereale]